MRCTAYICTEIYGQIGRQLFKKTEQKFFLPHVVYWGMSQSFTLFSWLWLYVYTANHKPDVRIRILNVVYFEILMMRRNTAHRLCCVFYNVGKDVIFRFAIHIALGYEFWDSSQGTDMSLFSYIGVCAMN